MIKPTAWNDDVTARIASELRARGFVRKGDTVVVVGAAPGGPAGHTNFIRLLRLAEKHRG